MNRGEKYSKTFRVRVKSINEFCCGVSNTVNQPLWALVMLSVIDWFEIILSESCYQ